MNILEQRKSTDKVIEERFIEQSLRDQAASILKDSRREMRGFSSSKWRDVNMTVNKNSLTYEHTAAHRFNDMKRLRGKGGFAKDGPKHKRKNYPIHNKVLFSNKRFLIKRLSFGFTEEVKNQFRKLLDDSE